MSLIRRACLIAFAVALASGWAGAAWAVDGGATDPSGDVMDGQTNERGPGKLDIVSNRHSDDGVRVRYVLTTKGPFGPEDTFLIGWSLYDLAGVEQWDCPPVNIGVRVEAGAFTGKVTRCNGSGGGGTSGPGGQQVLAPAQVVHAKDSNKIDVSYPISALRDAGFTGTSIQYRASTTDGAQNSDMLPDSDPTITHKLSPPTTPVPTVAPPQSTVVPTPVISATPAPTIEPKPPATPEIVSFARPEAGEDDGDSTSVPLKAVAVGSVIAGAGVVLLVLRPF